ncbi:CBS domain protein [Arcticibacter pallidicorallinus]|uniref:CBS domain protein n=1 Tax=Arcticibacter pallidicorallinus TaxID=1259464 RepID=A0A2T0TW53_9SPHI|nr:CBS domain-containing protein [Arcticibacter pallidicorallinus]PRY49891.1 CBS domain protein [Arcticibacter pallidicorallinus]
MKAVNDILKQKSSHVFSVNSTISVFDALMEMMEKNISALLVVDDGKLTGIFTERDYARKIALKGLSSRQTTIADVMTKDPLTIKLNDDLDYCMNLMTDKHIRHLPVIEDEKVVGMISIGDLVKAIIESQKDTIKQLEGYINS